LFINSLLELILVNNGDLPAIRCLNKYLGIQGALILQLNIAGTLLSIDDLPKVDLGLIRVGKVHLGLLAGANQGYVNWTCLAQQGEDSVDVKIQLRRKSDRDGRWKTGWHTPWRRVLYQEEVLDRISQGQELERVEGERNIGHQDGLSVRHTHCEVLKQDGFWFRNKRNALELSASHDLRLGDPILLPLAGLSHVLLL